MLRRFLKVVLYCLLFLFLIVIGGIYFLYTKKDQIIQHTLQHITQKTPYKISLDKVSYTPFASFPTITFVFHHVLIQDKKNIKNTLKAACVSVTFHLKSILQQHYFPEKLSIQQGTLSWTSPISSKSKKTEKKTKKQSIITFPMIKTIVLQNIHVKSNDSTGKPWEVYLQKIKATPFWKKHQLHFSTAGMMDIKKWSIYQKNQNLSNLQVQLKGHYDAVQKSIHLPKINIKQAKNYLKASGIFYSPEKIHAQLHAAQLCLQDIQHYTSALKAYSLMGNIHLQGNVRFLKKKKSSTFSWTIKKGQCTMPFDKNSWTLDDIQGQCMIPDFSRLEQSQLSIKKGHIYHLHHNIYGNLTLKNFKNPLLKTQCKGHVDFAALPLYHQIDWFPTQGKFSFDFKLPFFSLKKIDTIKPIGEISCHQVMLPLGKIFPPIEDIQAKIIMQDQQWQVITCKGHWQKGDFSLQGKLKYPFLCMKQKLILLHMKMSLQSSQLWIPPKLTSQNTTSCTQNPNSKNQWSFPIHLDLNYKINRCQWKKICLEKVTGQLHWKKNSLHVPTLSFQCAKGKGQLSGKFIPMERKKYFNTNFFLENIDCATLLSMTDHWLGSSVFTSKNTQGTFASHLVLQGTLTKNQHWSNNLEGTLAVKMHNMIFDQVNPLQKMTQYFRHREKKIFLDHLENVLTIGKGKIEIPKMTVLLKNCFQIDVSGEHSFQNVYRYHLKVPLKNFSKQYRKEKLGHIRPETMEGIYLGLVLKGKGNNYSIRYDTQALGKTLQKHYQQQKKDLQNILTGKYAAKAKDALALSEEDIE